MVALKIGLTGGIGSGKTTVSALFAAKGVPVIDADEIARELVRPGMPALEAIVAAFGSDIVKGGVLNRESLRERIFRNDMERRTLEDILHPLVYREMAERVTGIVAPYCILCIPLLVETAQRGFVDRVLVVDCSCARQIERVHSRDGFSASTVQRILAAQVSREERRRAADDIIDNDGALEELAPQVHTLHERYLYLAGLRPGHVG